MKTGNYHLTYCTNIHAAESWEETFVVVRDHVLAVKQRISANEPFGIGLRLSSQASIELLQGNCLERFRDFLKQNDLYVFTINGFPYGDFHGRHIKDQVYTPDWSGIERYRYSLRLIQILERLLPMDMEGSISTLPLSYRPWFTDQPAELKAFYDVAVTRLTKLVSAMAESYLKSGRLIHLDLEPEPDCLLQISNDVVHFFRQYLIPLGVKTLKQQGYSAADAEALIRRHIRICYDVCHFAVEYESPIDVFNKLDSEGIGIGKVQLSSALRTQHLQTRKKAQACFAGFDDPVYLHQSVAVNAKGEKLFYPDLEALLDVDSWQPLQEVRVHFHLPIFFRKNELFSSTQDAVEEVLELLCQRGEKPALEIETYTWDVLPPSLREDLTSSICREILWVRERLPDRCEAQNAQSGHS